MSRVRRGKFVRPVPLEELKDYELIHSTWLAFSILIPFLLITLAYCIGGDKEENRLNISQKMWDYISSKKPILVLAGDNFKVKEFIERNQLGYITSHSDTQNIVKTLNNIWREHKTKGVLKPKCSGFTRDEHDSIFANVCDDIIGAER